MARRRHPSPPPARHSAADASATVADARARVWACAALLAAATIAVYAGTFSVPFHFDDVPAIQENPTIRQLWPPGPALRPPPDSGLTVSGRPLLNFSFAVSHALSGEATWGHHVLNLAIHVAAGLALFGILRRTLAGLRRPAAAPSSLGNRCAAAALALATAVSAIWMLHPLQTESVTYIVQRAESLVGLFYLLTLYSFTRAVAGSGWAARGWLAASVAACVLGMASKEVMATAPLLVWLYDRTFVAGGFAAAWRARRGYYLALAATWLLLAALVIDAGGRGGSVGFTAAITPIAYLKTQAWAIVHYLRLVLWPAPLVLDYGVLLVTDPRVWLPCGLVVLALLGTTIAAVVRRPAAGFAGAWFFLILAPTSSVIPVLTQTVTEHRLYLPLAAPVALAVLGLFAWGGRRALFAAAAVAVLFGALSARRNRDYASVEGIWRDTIAKRPDNPRAHRNLGLTLYHAGDLERALASLERALQLEPSSAEVHNYLANVHLALGRVPDAARHATEAVRLAPEYGDAHNNLGVALVRQRRRTEAAAHFEAALRLMPRSASAHLNLANTRLDDGRPADALPLLDAAVRLEPGLAEAHLARGHALRRLGRTDEAAAAYARAVELRPALGEAHFALGNASVDLGRLDDGIAHLGEAVRLNPRSIPALNNLGDALARAGRVPEAIAVFERALALDPANAYLRDNLARLKAPER